MAPWRPKGLLSLASIRSRIFFAFLSIVVLTMGLGIYAFYAISAAGNTVVNIYDRPLMAINFSRSASLAFMQMNNALLQIRIAPKSSREALHNKRVEWTKHFYEDLKIAEERALTPRALQVLAQIRNLAGNWNVLANQFEQSRQDFVLEEINRVSEAIIQRFDVLIELTAGQSFAERQQAVRAIDWFKTAGIATTLLALLLSGAITFRLGRRIVRPLEAAAASAGQIAKGDLEAEIPEGGRDETGALLSSMRFMQANIRQMVAREQAQRESAQARLADALEYAGEGMLLLDGGGHILAVSARAGQFFPSAFPFMRPGASLADAFLRAGQDMRRGLASEEEIPAGQVVDALCAGGEFRLEGGRWIAVSSSATHEGGTFLFMNDITALKDREESLRIAKQAAEAANLAKTRFLANMSHELRTLLNAIIGFSEILSNQMFGSLGNPQYVEYCKDILRSGQGLLGIINAVLDLSRSESGLMQLDLAEINLAHLIDECAATFEPRCRSANLAFIVQNGAKDLSVRADRTRLRQVIVNLLSNAVKFTRAGGTVHLRVRAAGTEAYEIEVEDTGIGMSAEEISLAMAPFGQVDGSLARKFDGVGLGLPLTRVFVELHGGRLGLNSLQGQGTIARVHLPNDPAPRQDNVRPFPKRNAALG